MRTRFTDSFRAQLEEIGEDPQAFADEFDAWKALGPDGADECYAFGKDGEYSRPKVGGVSVLRHVHLASQLPHEMQVWDRNWRNRRLRTSDKALVYVQDATHGFLLLFILDEPGAHDVAEMRTPEDATLMRQFAAVADHFIRTGEIGA